MKLKLIVIGKTDFDFIEKGICLYKERILHYIPFEILVIPDIKNTGSLSINQVKTKESELLLNHINDSDYVVLLDDKGKEFTSLEFSVFLNKKMIAIKTLIFVIGGAYGFSEAIYKRSNEKISLSKLTFSHQIIRIIFLEQLYRGLTILKNEKYHHE